MDRPKADGSGKDTTLLGAAKLDCHNPAQRTLMLESPIREGGEPMTLQRLNLVTDRADNPAEDLAAPGSLGPFDELVGEGPVFDAIRGEIRRAATVSYPVLVTGETGTGKDLVARL